ncbi:MOSC domain-containing protein [Peribacillus sp. SCS-26]|uniref:MOSC domain-containing protein n=1 Tax=Paraperibacillus marinus TaxID=3115295 RepID=UPI00390628C8
MEHAGKVLAVSLSGTHTFSKSNQQRIMLVKGLGVEGDAHFGAKVKHRSRVKQNPDQPNLRQVHLIQSELFHELRDRFEVEPGDLGENITTEGIDLLSLPEGTLLHIGGSAVVKVTGLRNPCRQIDHFQPGLMDAVLDRDEDGRLVRKSGIMGVVTEGGPVLPGDSISITFPEMPYKALERV